MTSNVVSRVTASSTFNVPLTVVNTPVNEIFTTPPPVASEVAPEESNVETDVSPVTSNVLSIVTTPVFVTVRGVPPALISPAINPPHFKGAYSSIVISPIVSPSSVLHSTKVNSLLFRSHRSPLLALSVRVPSPRVKINPRSFVVVISS